MANIKKLLKRIKYGPFGKLKRAIQRVLYRLIFFCGDTILSLFKLFKIIRPDNKLVKENIKKILILRPDGIGDVVLSTPVFKALRENFPLAYIAVLVHEKNKDLIVNNPYINEIFTLRHKGIGGLFRNQKLIKKLTKKGFDLAVVLLSVLWCNLLAVICKIPHRLGYAFHGNGFLLNLKPAQKYEEFKKHEVAANLDLLRLIGIEPIKGELGVSRLEDAESKINNFLRNNNGGVEDKLIVIHPGANEECDRWSKEGFAKVADWILDNFNAQVIILGGVGEEDLVKKVVGLMKKNPIVAINLSLSEVISLIQRASLFIGNSTGTMHIASALKVPVVAIFGNSHPLDSYQRWGPYGTNNMIVHKDIGCIDCQPADCRRYRCMEAVSPQDVMESVKRLI